MTLSFLTLPQHYHSTQWLSPSWHCLIITSLPNDSLLRGIASVLALNPMTLSFFYPMTFSFLALPQYYHSTQWLSPSWHYLIITSLPNDSLLLGIASALSLNPMTLSFLTLPQHYLSTQWLSPSWHPLSIPSHPNDSPLLASSRTMACVFKLFITSLRWEVLEVT